MAPPVWASRLCGRVGIPVGVDVPAVVVGGRTLTAANIDPRWVGFDLGGAPEPTFFAKKPAVRPAARA